MRKFLARNPLGIVLVKYDFHAIASYIHTIILLLNAFFATLVKLEFFGVYQRKKSIFPLFFGIFPTKLLCVFCIKISISHRYFSFNIEFMDVKDKNGVYQRKKLYFSIFSCIFRKGIAFCVKM